MEKNSVVVYLYRWVVLGVFMLIIAANQLLWITFAPVTSEAMRYLNVSDLQIGVLSMCFMIVFIILSIPASWIIDRYGIRVGVGIGALLTGVFGLMRGLISTDYTSVLLSQIGIAAGQPFLLNAITKVASRWFPINERATAAGLGTLSMYVGIFAGMVVTPCLVKSVGMSSTLYYYGLFAAVAAVLFFIGVRERPLTPTCRPDQEERSLVMDGMKHIFKVKDFNLLMIIFFIGLGIFNCVTTWIENILVPRGFTAVEAGTTGGVMIFSGIMGAFIMPTISDHLRKRKPFIILAVIGAALGLAGVCFATSYWMLMFSGVVLGFFLLSSGPIGFQYGAEVTYPISEGTSNGFLLLMGQISGIVMILLMDMFKDPVTGSMTKPMLVLLVLMVIAVFISVCLKESNMLGDDDKQ
ncbi:MAG: MFS transporter [Bacteroidota bacterium]|nr:MFS transporter [Bacteroidota bacterium]